MSLRQEIPELINHWRKNKSYLAQNEVLFNIYEGDLSRYVLADLERQLGQKSFEQIRHRIAPINLFKRIVKKTSKIYQQSPVRTVEEGSDSDKELLRWYEHNFSINQKMNIANEFFSGFKATLVQPFLDPNCGTPKLRAVPPHQYLPYSKDIVNPVDPTHILLMAGTQQAQSLKSSDTVTLQVFMAFTDDEFLIFNEREEILADRMAAYNNPQGINPFRKIPFVYINRSHNLLIPMADSDTLAMTKLVPVLLSDLNFVSMYSAFSILYGIDIDNENLKMAPNAFWHFKSDPASDKKPELGQIKPQADISETLNLIAAEIAIWLESRGLKPGTVGTMDSSSFASGVSKLIDEMDATEERREQVQFFTNGERQLWDLVMFNMNPVWVSRGLIENRAMFSTNADILIKFADQIPMQTRGQIVRDQKDEVDAGFTTRKRSIQTLNPEMTDEQVDELIMEIDSERTVEVPVIEDDEPEMDEE